MVNLNLPQLQKPRWATQGDLPDTLNVIAVQWGDKYSRTYLPRLMASVRRNLPAGPKYSFYCLTDSDDIASDAKPLRADRGRYWPTWWHKMNLFDASVVPPGPTLYIDLDSVITGSLEPIIRSKADDALIIVENFSMNKRHCAHTIRR